jgi:hypothetical protein
VQIEVECYAGYRGEETPRRIVMGSKKLEVLEVLDRWQGPDHRYFKVRCDDDTLYIIRHDEAAGTWEITLMTRPELLGES